IFQAEDGIRDDLVTGVQTCALPISSTRSTMPACATTRSSRQWGSREPSDQPDPVPRVLRTEPGAVPGDGGSGSDLAGAVVRQQQIGRASCRDSDWSGVVCGCSGDEI